MCAFNDEGGRELHVMGTKAELKCSIDSEKIRVIPFIDRFSDHSVTYDVTSEEDIADVFGHGGGDYGIVRDLINLIRGEGETSSSMTNVDESIESHIIALAAEESRLNGGKLVNAKEFAERNRH